MKYSTDVVLSSGEESLQDFIFGADGSDDSGRMVIKGGIIVSHILVLFSPVFIVFIYSIFKLAISRINGNFLFFFLS